MIEQSLWHTITFSICQQNFEMHACIKMWEIPRFMLPLGNYKYQCKVYCTVLGKYTSGLQLQIICLKCRGLVDKFGGSRQDTGGCLTSIGVPMLKIRWSPDWFTFKMGNPIPVERLSLYWNRAQVVITNRQKIFCEALCLLMGLHPFCWDIYMYNNDPSYIQITHSFIDWWSPLASLITLGTKEA